MEHLTVLSITPEVPWFPMLPVKGPQVHMSRCLAMMRLHSVCMQNTMQMCAMQ